MIKDDNGQLLSKGVTETAEYFERMPNIEFDREVNINVVGDMMIIIIVFSLIAL